MLNSFACLLFMFLVIGAANAQWFRINNGGPPSYSTEKTAMPPGRRNAAMWCHDDDIYVYGGMGANGGPLNDLWKFETESGRWFWQPTPPTAIGARIRAPTWTANGRMWVYGAIPWSYNPDTREWASETPPSPVLNDNQTSYWVHLPGNAAYVYGPGTLEKFDIQSTTWSVISGSSTGPAPPTGGIATIGLNQDVAYVFERQLYTFDVTANRWALVNSTFPDSRTDASMWVAPDQDKLLIFGGKIGAEVLGDTWVYRFNDDMWVRDSDQSPSQRWGASSCTNAAGSTYVFGGAMDDPGKMHNDLWKYGPLNRQNLLDILDFQLNSTSISSYAAMVIAILILVFLAVKEIIKCGLRCCKRKRDREYQQASDAISLNIGGAFDDGQSDSINL